MVFGSSPGLTQSSVVPQEATDNDGAQTNNTSGVAQFKVNAACTQQRLSEQVLPTNRQG